MIEICEISKAIENYYNATKTLREIIKTNPLIFSKTALGPGSIAEYDSAIYLKKKYTDCKVTFGHGSQRGWDLLVENNSTSIRIQVKCVDEHSGNRKITFSNKAFDQLIVLSLGDYLVPMQAFLFETIDCLKKARTLTLPSSNNPAQRGSDVFRTDAKNISHEFWESME